MALTHPSAFGHGLDFIQAGGLLGVCLSRSQVSDLGARHQRVGWRHAMEVYRDERLLHALCTFLPLLPLPFAAHQLLHIGYIYPAKDDGEGDQGRS